jgi:heterotetrameric sarcosine oxidase delta subunit
MLLVPCPHCGPRNSTEFRHAGEARARPDGSAALTEWRDHLYLRDNAAGWVRETWYHAMGCRRFFPLERDTVSNRTRPARPPDDDG